MAGLGEDRRDPGAVDHTEGGVPFRIAAETDVARASSRRRAPIPDEARFDPPGPRFESKGSLPAVAQELSLVFSFFYI